MSVVTELLNAFVNVRNKVKDKSGTWVDETKPYETQFSRTWLRRSIGTDGEYSVFESWGKRIILEQFEYSTSDGNIYPTLWIVQGETSKYSSELFHVLTPGAGRQSATPKGIEENGHSLLEVTSRDATTGIAKVQLKRPLVIPRGCKLVFFNLGSSAADVTYKAYWREVEGE